MIVCRSCGHIQYEDMEGPEEITETINSCAGCKGVGHEKLSQVFQGLARSGTAGSISFVPEVQRPYSRRPPRYPSADSHESGYWFSHSGGESCRYTRPLIAQNVRCMNQHVGIVALSAANGVGWPSITPCPFTGSARSVIPKASTSAGHAIKTYTRCIRPENRKTLCSARSFKASFLNNQGFGRAVKRPYLPLMHKALTS